MFELIILLVFIWLVVGVIRLTAKVAWGATKVVATILMVLALPVLVLALLFAGGIVLLVPVGLVVGAFALLKACVK